MEYLKNFNIWSFWSLFAQIRKINFLENWGLSILCIYLFLISWKKSKISLEPIPWTQCYWKTWTNRWTKEQDDRQQLGGQTDQNPENLFTKLGSNISSFINSVADENLVEKLNKYRQFTKLLMIRNSSEVMRR